MCKVFAAAIMMLAAAQAAPVELDDVVHTPTAAPTATLAVPLAPSLPVRVRASAGVSTPVALAAADAKTEQRLRRGHKAPKANKARKAGKKAPKAAKDATKKKWKKGKKGKKGTTTSTTTTTTTTTTSTTTSTTTTSTTTTSTTTTLTTTTLTTTITTTTTVVGTVTVLFEQLDWDITDLAQLKGALRLKMKDARVKDHATMRIDLARGSIVATLYPLDFEDFDTLMNNLADIKCGAAESAMEHAKGDALTVEGKKGFTGAGFYAVGKTGSDTYCYEVLVGVSMTQAHMIGNGMSECSAAAFSGQLKDSYDLGTTVSTKGSTISFSGGSGKWCPNSTPRAATVTLYQDPYATEVTTKATEPKTCMYVFQVTVPTAQLPKGVYERAVIDHPNATQGVNNTGAQCITGSVSKNVTVGNTTSIVTDQTLGPCVVVPLEITCPARDPYN